MAAVLSVRHIRRKVIARGLMVGKMSIFWSDFNSAPEGYQAARIWASKLTNCDTVTYNQCLSVADYTYFNSVSQVIPSIPYKNGKRSRCFQQLSRRRRAAMSTCSSEMGRLGDGLHAKRIKHLQKFLLAEVCAYHLGGRAMMRYQRRSGSKCLSTKEGG